MYDNYVKLQIEGLTRGSELQDAFILVLSERENEQFLPILVNHEGYLRLKAALHDGDYTPTKLMNQLARRVGMTLIGVRIMAPKNGETNALIDFEAHQRGRIDFGSCGGCGHRCPRNESGPLDGEGQLLPPTPTK